jgi:hypothetical protein
MNMTELSAFRTAANKAAADLETAKNRLAVARHEVDLLTEVRANLPFDEKKIAAHIDNEKAADLKCEITERLFAAAESALAVAKANLVSAEWQFEQEQLQARSDALAARFRTEFVAHAEAIADLLSANLKLQEDTHRFQRRFLNSPNKGTATILLPFTQVNLMRSDLIVIHGPDARQIWPCDWRQRAATAAVDQSIG